MAKPDVEDEGGRTYSARVRKRQKTKIKRRKRWAFRRVASIIGFVAAFFAVLSIVSPPVQNRILGALSTGYGWLQDIRGVLNGYTDPLLPIVVGPIRGLGDIILIVLLVVIVVMLLRVSEPAITRKIDEMMMEMRVRSEVTQKEEKEEAPAQTQAPPMPYMPYMPPAAPARTLQLSASAVVNAPRGRVWEVLNEVVYVPTCQELLESVEVLGKVANALTWEGKVRVGRRHFPVEGTTTLFPPTRMEVQCTRGALLGFRGVLSLSEVQEGTRLTETAEFDPAKIRDEYSPVANALSTRGSEILSGDLQHFDKLIKALLTPGDQEEVSG